ncbi:MAG: chromate resistance protein, partial [Planctomycetes bacterium]|nr:chromate resistance protein [Planctomycetota bacterium]
MKLGLCACATILACLAGCSETKPVSNVFTTWTTMEFDKCASAWIIIRYVDKQAQFKFFPKGSVIEEGTPFDIPGAELTRAHGLACAETVIGRYNITDTTAVKLARIAHEIEINPWA